MTSDLDYVVQLITECKEETNIDNRVLLLRQIYSNLPEHLRVKIPSLITNDYINNALFAIEKSFLIQ